MRIYLDTCALNRPFDPKSSLRVSEEAVCVRSILDRIADGQIELVWSSALDFEIAQNPSLERRDQIKKWGDFAILDIEETQNVLDGSKNLIKFGLKFMDVIHVASAIEGSAEYFVTTDDGILKRSESISNILICGPATIIDLGN